MRPTQACPLPPHALLARYAHAGAYTDCYGADLAGSVSHAQYVETFYTGALFKLERWLLGVFVHRPSTDAQARQLARGEREDFAAWRVEARSADQLLLCDMAGRTRSWLMVAAAPGPRTRLYFGSAVVPVKPSGGGAPRMGFGFSALLGLHRVYSVALLGSAHARLARRAAPDGSEWRDEEGER
jgi:hypothetical protein